MNLVQYLFENSAELDKDFVLGNKETLSYKKLYSDSCGLAAYLSENYGEGKNIILVSNNNSFFIVCYLGIILSGNVCVPLNPLTEKRNFEYVVDKTEASVCFIENKLKNKLALKNLNNITDSEYRNLTQQITEFDFTPDFDEEKPAKIIFTSGSTGQPKGVVLSHKNIITNTNSILGYLQLNSNDIMEVVLPFYYCYGLSLLHTHLRVGGSLVLNNNFMFTGTLVEDLNNYKCTGFAGVPSHFQILLRNTKSFKSTSFPHLKYVTQAGGKLHNSFINEFVDNFPAVKFFVMYGQTEATARLSYLDPAFLNEKMGSIGKGIPGVQLKIVNSLGDEVKPGESGELIAKGNNIMNGYFRDEKETQKVIKNNWLYTGDLGTTDNDGFIYLTGRKKEFIKVFGKRISPKEIEEVIVSNPDVVDCTVEPVYDEITGEAIKAVVILKNNKQNETTENDIKAYCASKLAQYKIPKIIEFSNRLRINSAGKKISHINYNYNKLFSGNK